MGIADRDRADLERLAVDLEAIAVGFLWRIERQGGWIEAHRPHIHRDRSAGPHSRVHQPGRTVERDGAAAAGAAPRKQCGNAACTVAALLHFAPVGVEDAVERVRFGSLRRLQQQRLIESDAGVTVGEPAQLLLRQRRGPGRRIEHREVVAETVHLGEADAHRREHTVTASPRSDPEPLAQLAGESAANR
ncbi:hypothetical protein B1A_21266 [mine drainage metagenome]|uniref:Uncharacterized protein n=1 Tax=mine drainage metagenome TaxID=410659 RepID=T0Y8Q3_9ZZZZ